MTIAMPRGAAPHEVMGRGSAAVAFAGWSRLAARERGDRLRRIADRIAAKASPWRASRTGDRKRAVHPGAARSAASVELLRLFAGSPPNSRDARCPGTRARFATRLVTRWGCRSNHPLERTAVADGCQGCARDHRGEHDRTEAGRAGTACGIALRGADAGVACLRRGQRRSAAMAKKWADRSPSIPCAQSHLHRVGAPSGVRSCTTPPTSSVR